MSSKPPPHYKSKKSGLDMIDKSINFKHQVFHRQQIVGERARKIEKIFSKERRRKARCLGCVVLFLERYVNTVADVSKCTVFI